MRRRALGVVCLTACLGLGGCTQSGPPESTGSPTASSPDAGASTTPAAPTAPAAPTTPSPTASRAPAPAEEFNARAALRDIERLAGDIGPREATSAAFSAAADLVEERLADLGYTVDTERVDVPEGNSWGTPVDAGRSRNVIADPPGFEDTEPHVVVGAHLDTIPVAPGAEDNASGVSVLLELARLAAAEPAGLPVRFIAFGAEEPRGSGDSMHHFGSQQHVADLSGAEREAVRGMVALDRVGVRSSAVPVCSALASGNDLRGDLRRAARSVDMPTRACSQNTTSDHWSYAKTGIPAVRLGSVPYDEYHSERDTPDVIDRRQIDRVGSLMWAWLQSLD